MCVCVCVRRLTSSKRSSISLAALPFMCSGQVTQMPMSPGSIVLALGLSDPSLLGTLHLPLLPVYSTIQVSQYDCDIGHCSS